MTVTATSKADPGGKGTATVNLIGNGVKFVGKDILTTGNWPGIYGSAGWALAALPANIVKLPPYLSTLNLPVSPGPAVYSYGDPSPDPRGLQKPPLLTTRVAAVWTDPNVLELEFDFTDFQTHRVAVYFTDFDTNGRTERIEMIDPQAPPAALDTQNIATLNGGQYLVWDLSGRILMRITHTGGLNAIFSAVFFQ